MAPFPFSKVVLLLGVNRVYNALPGDGGEAVDNLGSDAM